ncbi:MAG TPA: hypothetical protein VFO38_03100 [Candidatus Saccharimonadales bacterium]|nr:hypothetical protein [Candidatus Saccharimonadales bacterium]
MDPQLQPSNNVPQQPVTPTQPPAPTPVGPPQGKNNTLLIVAAVAVVAILGVLAFMMFSPSNTNNSQPSTGSNPSSNTTTPDPSKYQTYNVTDKQTGAAFTVSFYKNAKVEEKNGRTYLNSGEAGSMYSVYLGAATGDKIDCGNSPSTTMKLGGESTTVCYAEDYMQYAGYAKSKKGPVKINLAGQKAISIEEAKTIMESVVFN